MWRSIVALGLVAALAAPAAAQVDSSRATRPRYRLTDTTRGGRRSYSITSREEGWLGMGLACSHCSLSVTGRSGTRRWSFTELPSVYSVDDEGPADHAGLRIGDVLVAVDGVSLTTSDGGSRFGGIKPGQSVRLTYRREDRERTVTLVAGARPVTDSRELAEAARAMRQAEEEQERALARSHEELERSQAQLERIRSLMERRLEEAQSRQDSTSLEQLERMRSALAEQQAALARTLAERSTLEGRTLSDLTPPPAQPAPPAMPARPEAPEPAEAPVAPMPPTSYREHRGFGPLRYTGRLGDVVIEARGPGGVTATEISDSEVVVTSGDLSVRLALRPIGPRTPVAAPTPAPAPTARPPQD